MGALASPTGPCKRPHRQYRTVPASPMAELMMSTIQPSELSQTCSPSCGQLYPIVHEVSEQDLPVLLISALDHDGGK